MVTHNEFVLLWRQLNLDHAKKAATKFLPLSVWAIITVLLVSTPTYIQQKQRWVGGDIDYLFKYCANEPIQNVFIKGNFQIHFNITITLKRYNNC